MPGDVSIKSLFRSVVFHKPCLRSLIQASFKGFELVKESGLFLPAQHSLRPSWVCVVYLIIPVQIVVIAVVVAEVVPVSIAAISQVVSAIVDPRVIVAVVGVVISEVSLSVSVVVVEAASAIVAVPKQLGHLIILNLLRLR